jgi:hypothetical protein
MTVLAMSRTEIDRMSVLHDLADGRIRIAEASALMGLGRRQVFRLAKNYAQRGPEALVSRKRGRPRQPPLLLFDMLARKNSHLALVMSESMGV